MLKNLPIQAKLAVILVIPVLALAILGSLRISSSLASSQQAGQTGELTEFSLSGTGLVHELQNERGLSVRYLGVEGRTVGNELQEQWATTDRVLAGFRQDLDRLDLDALDEAAVGELNTARNQLDELTRVREQTAQGQGISISGLTGYYGETIAALINTNREIGTDIADRELAREVNAFVQLSRVKEVKAVERDQVTELFALRRGDVADYGDAHRSYTSTLATEAVLLSEFREVTNEQQRTLYTDTVVGPEVQRVREFQSAAAAAGQPASLTIEPAQWWNVTTFEIGLLRDVEAELGGTAVSLGQDIEQAARSQTILDSVVIVLVLLVSLSLSLLVARSMVRPLGVLRVTAEAVARIRLPGVVERFQRAEQVELPVETAPVRVLSNDEIGKVASAFNSVHNVAVRVAAEQAGLRRSVGDMFQSMGRRIQVLVARQLQLLDELEREETNPAQLNSLFRLDHLATRMRRNAENLLVLSGTQPDRKWSEPVALSGILRAAAAEIEDYTRVVIRPARDVQVAGEAVNDLVHLLAELLENATRFSSADSTVHVAGDSTVHGFVVEIEDQGRGMTEEEMAQANERLANPPQIDLTVAQRLGFFVVGRLAGRHGIRIRLRSSWYGGVTALVVIPPNLISEVPGGAAGSENGGPPSQELPARPITGELPAQSPRPQVPPPAPAPQGPPQGPGPRIPTPQAPAAQAPAAQTPPPRPTVQRPAAARQSGQPHPPLPHAPAAHAPAPPQSPPAPPQGPPPPPPPPPPQGPPARPQGPPTAAPGPQAPTPPAQPPRQAPPQGPAPHPQRPLDAPPQGPPQGPRPDAPPMPRRVPARQRQAQPPARAGDNSDPRGGWQQASPNGSGMLDGDVTTPRPPLMPSTPSYSAPTTSQQPRVPQPESSGPGDSAGEPDTSGQAADSPAASGRPAPPAAAPDQAAPSQAPSGPPTSGSASGSDLPTRERRPRPPRSDTTGQRPSTRQQRPLRRQPPTRPAADTPEASPDTGMTSSGLPRRVPSEPPAPPRQAFSERPPRPRRRSAAPGDRPGAGQPAASAPQPAQARPSTPPPTPAPDQPADSRQRPAPGPEPVTNGRSTSAPGQDVPTGGGTTTPQPTPEPSTEPSRSPAAETRAVGEPPSAQQRAAEAESAAAAEAARNGRLPRRIPMSRLAPALFDETLPPPDDTPGDEDDQAAPERVRTILSAFRSGTERGRRAAEARLGGERTPSRPAEGAGDDELG